MIPDDMPLLEFDPSPRAVIEPSIHRPTVGFPARALVCWFGNVVRERTAGLTPVHHVPFEHGDHAICVIEHRGEPIALVSPGVGAPAAVTTLDVIIALGGSKIVGCGGAGIVRPGFPVGHVIVPTRSDPRRGHQLPLRGCPHRGAAAPVGDRSDRRGARRSRCPARSRAHMDHRRVLPGDTGVGGPSPQAGLHHGRDGRVGDVRLCHVPRRRVRSIALRG